MMKLWAVVAAAAMGLTACQGNFDEQVGADVKNSVTVKFVAEEARTAVDTSGDTPLFSWDDDETFVVLEQTDDLAESTSVSYAKVDGKATITAEFDENAGKDEYKYIAIYPESNYGYGDTMGINVATLILPELQYMYSESSYDPNADLMVSLPVTTSAQPTEAQQLRFTRLAAVVEMSINNLTLAAGEEVESVEFTANGKALAGTITADLEDPHAFTVKEGVSSVSITNAPANKVYFTVLPTTLKAEDEDAYSVVVVTNKSVYIKQGVIPEGKSLAFEAGKVTRFGVNMTDALVGAKWKLVRDASELKGGDVVTIVAKNYNYVIGKPSTSVYPLASQTEVVKAGNYLYHKPADDTANHMMQTYTLMQRDTNLNLFDFYNGVDFEGDTSVGFAQATGSNYTPKLQAFCDNSTLFEVSIADGVASVTASKITGSYKYWRYYHSTTASSRKFDLTSSPITNDANKILLYRLEGAVGTIPVVAANVTVPDSDESVVIAEEGVAEATAIEEVVFNYVGDWKISVSDNAEWLNVAYDAAKNCLAYTAEANVNPKRDAVVTITASLEGQESLTWSFNLVQKGASQEISIVDFAKKGQDVDTVYKLTGIITEIPSSTSGKFKIADENGNTAQVQYFKTEAGAYVKGNVDIKVGDVVSLTTVVAGTTVGLGGNSSYPSIYKGHYSIAATASGSVEYLGGNITINVNVVKSGNIVAPTSISSAEVATDGNPISTYNFTDNGDGTATAVVGFGENTTGGSRKANLTFSAGSPLAVSTTVSVMQEVNPALKKGWWLVTDVNDLAAGDKIIIAATGIDYAISTETNTNNRKSKSITKVGAALENVADNIQQYALEIDTNGLYSFKGTLGTDANKYIYASSSSSNYMKVSTTLDDNGKFTIAIASDGAATVIAQGSNTRNHMQYNNKATSAPAFYCTDGSFGAVCFYKLYE